MKPLHASRLSTLSGAPETRSRCSPPSSSGGRTSKAHNIVHAADDGDTAKLHSAIYLKWP